MNLLLEKEEYRGDEIRLYYTTNGTRLPVLRHMIAGGSKEQLQNWRDNKAKGLVEWFMSRPTNTPRLSL